MKRATYTCAITGIVYQVTVQDESDTGKRVQVNGRADRSVPGQESCQAWFCNLWLSASELKTEGSK